MNGNHGTTPHLDLAFWRVGGGAPILDAATRLGAEVDHDAARLALKLKRLFPDRAPAELNGAVDIVVARHKASLRLGGWTKDAFLTARSVEQASRPEFSRYRAERFGGAKHLLEIGAASGFDTAALARVVDRVTALEPDPFLAEMARHNLALLGIANVEIITQTAEEFVRGNTLERFDAVFADPSRRDDGGNRIRSSEEYLPPLPFLLDIPIHGRRAIKISPAVDVEVRSGWSRQFLGLGGECLEQTLWFGLAEPPDTVFLADRCAGWCDDQREPEYLPLDAPLKGYLYDPHPALVRARGVGSLYAHLGIAQLDPRCAYGASPTLIESPLLKPFRIIEVLPFRIREVSERLHARGWTSRTEIKKRGVDLDPDEVRRKLKLPRPADAHSLFGVVLLGRRGESVTAVLAERIPSVKESDT